MKALVIKLLLGATCSVLLAGCLSNQVDPYRNFQSYVGLSSSDLAKQLGKPEQQYEKDGATILVYRPVSFNVPLPIPTPTVTGTSSGGVVMATPQTSMSISSADQKVYANCNVYFSLKNDVVQSWTATGKECPRQLTQTRQ